MFEKESAELAALGEELAKELERCGDEQRQLVRQYLRDESRDIVATEFLVTMQFEELDELSSLKQEIDLAIEDAARRAQNVLLARTPDQRRFLQRLYPEEDVTFGDTSRFNAAETSAITKSWCNLWESAGYSLEFVYAESMLPAKRAFQLDDGIPGGTPLAPTPRALVLPIPDFSRAREGWEKLSQAKEAANAKRDRYYYDQQAARWDSA